MVPVLDVVSIEKEMESAPIPVSEVVVTEPVMKPTFIPVSEDVDAKQETEPTSIHVSEAVVTNEEIEPPAPISKIVSLGVDISILESVGLPTAKPTEFDLVGGDRSYCLGVIAARECGTRSRGGYSIVISE